MLLKEKSRKFFQKASLYKMIFDHFISSVCHVFTRTHGRPLDFCITTRPHGRRTFTKYVIKSKGEKQREKRQLVRELKNNRKQILGTENNSTSSKESEKLDQQAVKQDPKNQKKYNKRPRNQRNQNR